MQHLNLTLLIRKLNPSESPTGWIQQTRPLAYVAPPSFTRVSLFSGLKTPQRTPSYKDPSCPQMTYIIVLRQDNLLWDSLSWDNLLNDP